jgi:hypothetical protein
MEDCMVQTTRQSSNPGLVIALASQIEKPIHTTALAESFSLEGIFFLSGGTKFAGLGQRDYGIVIQMNACPLDFLGLLTPSIPSPR